MTFKRLVPLDPKVIQNANINLSNIIDSSNKLYVYAFNKLEQEFMDLNKIEEDPLSDFCLSEENQDDDDGELEKPIIKINNNEQD